MSDYKTLKVLTCQKRNDILGKNYEGWHVASSLTDMDGYYGEPRIETVWEKDGRFIQDILHPNRDHTQPDVAPCEHYELEQILED